MYREAYTYTMMMNILLLSVYIDLKLHAIIHALYLKCVDMFLTDF